MQEMRDVAKVAHYLIRDFSRRSAALQARRFGVGHIPDIVRACEVLAYAGFVLAVAESLAIALVALALPSSVFTVVSSGITIRLLVLGLVFIIVLTDQQRQSMLERHYGTKHFPAQESAVGGEWLPLILSLDMWAMELAAAVVVARIAHGDIALNIIGACLIGMVMARLLPGHFTWVNSLSFAIVLSVFLFSLFNQNQTSSNDAGIPLMGVSIGALVAICAGGVTWLAQSLAGRYLTREAWYAPVVGTQGRERLRIAGTLCVAAMWFVAFLMPHVAVLRNGGYAVILALAFMALFLLRAFFVRTISPEAPGMLLIVMKRTMANSLPNVGAMYSKSAVLILLPVYLNASACVYVLERRVPSVALTIALMACEFVLSAHLVTWLPAILPASRIESLPEVSKLPIVAIFSAAAGLFLAVFSPEDGMASVGLLFAQHMETWPVIGGLFGAAVCGFAILHYERRMWWQRMVLTVNVSR